MTAACGGSGGGSGAGHDGHGEESPPAFDASAATATLEVTLKDFTIAGLSPAATGPNLLFNAEVNGASQHELAVHDASGHLGGLAPFRAGKKKRLAIVLAPGTYTVQCLVKEGSRTHAELGMKAQLTVQ
ncbi:MAG: hypothetical protein ACRD0M_12070 [Acidimicrobiales bacterium]